ncbi:hypothetical protein [Nocardioides sp. InS609-2]|uniref:hypothetical protein n=1 Tax=Nocardioides sp. InS609-2 TaxID=2760705 RepID=UPI0020C148A0|nr:hypothetical protein [Nocardioides sp. InS609-2]
MSNQYPDRIAAGVPTGGQFATSPRGEASGVALAERPLMNAEEARLIALAEGRPVRVSPRPDGYYDETVQAAGDASLGIEPSVFSTWAMPSHDEPFVSAEVRTFVTAHLDGQLGTPRLDYSDWEEIVDRLDAARAAEEKASALETLGGVVHPDHHQDVRDEIQQLRRYADGIRGEVGGTRLVYAVEQVTSWTAHTDPDDPGSSEVRADVEYAEEPLAEGIDALDRAESAARSRAVSTTWSRYHPENWK